MTKRDAQENAAVQQQELKASHPATYGGLAEIVRRHRREIELSPGVGAEVQRYGIAVCDDILGDLERSAVSETASRCQKCGAICDNAGKCPNQWHHDARPEKTTALSAGASTTPRTDAEECNAPYFGAGEWVGMPEFSYVSADFARQLERELADAQQGQREALSAFERARDSLTSATVRSSSTTKDRSSGDNDAER